MHPFLYKWYLKHQSSPRGMRTKEMRPRTSKGDPVWGLAKRRQTKWCELPAIAPNVDEAWRSLSFDIRLDRIDRIDQIDSNIYIYIYIYVMHDDLRSPSSSSRCKHEYWDNTGLQWHAMLAIVYTWKLPPWKLPPCMIWKRSTATACCKVSSEFC